MIKHWQVQKNVYSFLNVQTITSSEKCYKFSNYSNNNKFRKSYSFPNVQSMTSSEKYLQFSKCSNNNKFTKMFTAAMVARQTLTDFKKWFKILYNSIYLYIYIKILYCDLMFCNNIPATLINFRLVVIMSSV